MKPWKILIAALFIAGAVHAAESVDIAAVVNNSVISTLDLNDRVAIVMSTTGIPDTEENRARLLPQILRQLVDEHLQMEEGERDNITVTDDRVKQGIAKIEEQSGKPPGSLQTFLAMNGLSQSSFNAQVRAQITWADIVMKKIRPRIKVSDQEVARYVARKGAKPQPAVAKPAPAEPLGREVKISLLQLPVDSAKNELKMRAIAIKLAQEIHAGVKFEAVAAQFSSSTGNTHIGEPFWIETSQMDPLLVKAITGLPKGGVSNPVRTGYGYQIVKFIDSRHPVEAKTEPVTAAKPAADDDDEREPRAELAYKQILMNLKPDAQDKEAELLLKLSREVAKNPGKCEDQTMAGAGDLADLDFTVTLNRAVSDTMPEKLRDLLMMMKIGAVSQPIVTPEGIRLFMLCERVELPADKNIGPEIASASSTRQTIFTQKLELEAQKFMRDLRREAFVGNPPAMILQAVIALLPPLLIVAGIAGYARRHRFDKTTTLLLLSALGLYYFHFYHSTWTQFTIDAEPHMAYLRFILDTHRLPLPTDNLGAAARHPPAFYVAGAAIYGIAQNVGLAPEQFTRHLAMACYAVFIVMGTGILRLLLKEISAAYYGALLLLLFWPIGVTMGGRVSCDILLFAAQAGSLFALMRWQEERTPARLCAPFLWGGVAVAGKNSGFFMILFACLALMQTVRNERRNLRIFLRPDLAASIAFALVCAALSFWHGWILQHIESTGYYWDYLFARLGTFNPFLFIYDMELGLSQDSFWNMWLHTLLLGDGAMRWNYPGVMMVSKILWLALLFYAAEGLLAARKTLTQLEKNALILFACFIAVMMIAALFLLMRTANPNYMDARYAYPSMILFAIMHGIAMKHHREAGRASAYRMGSLLAGSFAVTTVLLFATQYLA